jgi:hypothetical protein
MQLEVEALKLYDSTISNLELNVRDVPRVVSLAYYIQGWRQSIWVYDLFQEFKTRNGIWRNKSWEQQTEAKEAFKRVFYK